ncbi:MAG: multidrug efflux RND transporter permease subunit [Pseudomonas sp.]
MTPHFFIKRPVFAWVIALIIGLGGLLALRDLPVEQYPTIAPPSLTISVTYPGADASTLETNVTQVIEQELNGVDGFLYMQATSRSNGSASIELTFAAGTDIDKAQMEVQNRLSRVEQRLPEEVRRQGVQVNQASSSFLMIVALSSRTGATSALELGNFVSAQVVDELRRVPGVGDIRDFSTQYAMRIWLDPDRLASFGLSASDVLAAVREQNSQSAGGALGDLPNTDKVEITATIQTRGQMSSAEEFSAIILRADADGSSVRLRDVARVELGAESYLNRLEINGQESAGMAVQLTPGANALDVAAGVKQRMAELERNFPEDIDWLVPYDSTPFISASIKEVLITLSVAMLLVFTVMFVFLQSWRATLIPTVVVPIALAGACMGLWLFGFSINLLSLFAMILAIGTLVDDAIVVVENVERLMEEEGLSPYQATVKAMDQVTSAIIGTTLVLIAVFLPMAFFPGSTGGIYRQFSVTLAISVAVSTVLALSLTPALCAALLKPVQRSEDGNTALPLGKRIFAPFNRFVHRTTDRYQRGVGGILVRPLRFLLVFVVLLVVAAFLLLRLPGSFVPAEDQGSLITVVQGPSGSTAARTTQAVEEIKAYYDEVPQVDNVVFVHGFSFFGQGQAHAISFVSLLPWDERPGVENSAQTLVQRAMGRLMQIKEASVFVLNPPAIPALGVAGGFTFKLQDRSGAGPEALIAARNQLLGAASQSDLLVGVRPEGEEAAPRLRVDVDRIKARALGLSISDINSTLSITFGSAYANDFTREGRIHRVMIQADADFRMTPTDVLNLKVRNADGDIVPFGAFTSVTWTAGPPQLQRYNGYPATTISGSAAPGRSSGQAMDEMERLAAQLPEGFGFEWTGLSFEEKQAAGQVGALMGLSVLIVLLVLAALYESWTIPLAVLLVVPLGVLGAVLFSMFRGLPADVYFNVGLITVIGLSAKNAILIIEFAIEEEGKGRSVMEATMAAVRLRLRPILMTSLTFILGMLPLVIATGPGAASRIAVGTGVMGGMVLATALGVFFTPLFYLAVRRWLTRTPPPGADPDSAEPQDDQEKAHA